MPLPFHIRQTREIPTRLHIQEPLTKVALLGGASPYRPLKEVRPGPSQEI